MAHCNRELFTNMLCNDKVLIEAHRKMSIALGIPFNLPEIKEYSQCNSNEVVDNAPLSISNLNNSYENNCPSER